jgi:toxin secretion/phage lysis holin
MLTNGKLINIVKALIGGLSSGTAYLLGGFDGLMKALLIFMVIDYITGTLVAIKLHKLSSKTGFIGIARKLMILAIIIIANTLDVEVLNGTPIARSVATVFYISNEGISIIENLSNFGVPIPEQLKSTLAQLKEKPNVKE